MDTNKCGKIQSGSETWDYGEGGTNRDLDNDGVWDYGEGGADEDLDNDGVWSFATGYIQKKHELCMMRWIAF